MAVKIVTDSTADLPGHLVRELGITVVPLNVHFGETVYRDGVDMAAEEFYRRLASSKALPTTSQPPAGAFVEVYRELARGGDAIVSVHISAKLSGTCNSALLAKQELGEGCQIEVVDSQSCTVGLGLTVLAAARAARKGLNLGQVVLLTRDVMSRTRTFALIDTLEYLEKGGRIGKAQAFLGSILQVKPIITIRDGEVFPLERVRTRGKALARLRELARGCKNIAELAVAHNTTPGDAESLAKDLAPLVPEGWLHRSVFGPVIGTHTGPGAVGLALVEGAG